MQFPVLIKSKIAAKEKFAHYFICVNNEAGLKEALNFEGYDQKELLI